MQKSACVHRCPTPLGPNLRTHQARLEKEEQGEERQQKIEARRLMERRPAQQKQKPNYRTKRRPTYLSPYLPTNNLRRGRAVVSSPPSLLVRPLLPVIISAVGAGMRAEFK